MPRPSMNAIRRAGVAGALGAGMALIGISLTGMASLDSDLRAASERLERPAVHDQRVSFRSQRPGACHRSDGWRSRPRQAPAALPTT